eukprot:3340726-Pleurochrysis_carterae.AAC.1
MTVRTKCPLPPLSSPRWLAQPHPPHSPDISRASAAPPGSVSDLGRTGSGCRSRVGPSVAHPRAPRRPSPAPDRTISGFRAPAPLSRRGAERTAGAPPRAGHP